MLIRAEEIQDLASQVANRKMDVLDAAGIVVASQCLLVGTADIFCEQIGPTYAETYDVEELGWRPYPSGTGQKVVRATDIPIAGVLSAIAGTYNRGGPFHERQQMAGPNGPLTTLPRPHYSWNHSSTRFYALPEVINAALARGTSLKGILGIVIRDDSFELTAEVGHYFSLRDHKFIGRLPVNGTDFPRRVQPCRYIFAEGDQGQS